MSSTEEKTIDQDPYNIYLNIAPKNSQTNEISDEFKIETDTVVSVDFTKDNSNIKDRELCRPKTFSKVFTPQSTIEDIYSSTLKSSVLKAFSGTPILVLNVGETDSKKTVTQIGTEENHGLLYYALTDLFAFVKKNEDVMKYKISLTMLNIATEKIRDLFVNTDSSTSTHSLLASCDREKNVIIRGITETEIHNVEEGLKLAREGEARQHNNKAIVSVPREDSCSVLIVTLFHDSKGTREILGKIRFVESIATKSRVSAGVHSLLQNIHVIYDRGARRYFDKIRKLCYVLKGCYERNSQVFTYIHIRGDSDNIKDHWETVDYILNTIRSKPNSRSESRYKTMSTLAGTLPSLKSLLTPSTDQLNEVKDLKDQLAARDKELKESQNHVNENTNNVDLEEFEMEIRQKLMEEWKDCLIDDEEKENLYQTRYKQYYELLLQREKDNMEQLLADRERDIEDLQQMLTESEQETERVRQMYERDEGEDTIGEMNLKSFETLKTVQQQLLQKEKEVQQKETQIDSLKETVNSRIPELESEMENLKKQLYDSSLTVTVLRGTVDDFTKKNMELEEICAKNKILLTQQQQQLSHRRVLKLTRSTPKAVPSTPLTSTPVSSVPATPVAANQTMLQPQRNITSPVHVITPQSPRGNGANYIRPPMIKPLIH